MSAVSVIDVPTAQESILIELKDHLLSSGGTSFSFKIDSGSCQENVLTYQKVTPTVSFSNGLASSSGVESKPIININNLSTNLDFKVYLFSDSTLCSGDADFESDRLNVLEGEPLVSTFQIDSAATRDSISSVGSFSYCVAVDTLTNDGLSLNFKILGLLDYTFLPSAPSNLYLISPSTTPSSERSLTFSNSEGSMGDKLILYRDADCSSATFDEGYYISTSANVSTTIPASVGTGDVVFSAMIESGGVKSSCSSSLYTYSLDVSPPGSIAQFTVQEGYSTNQYIGNIELGVKVSATNFESGEKISFHHSATCSDNYINQIDESGNASAVTTVSDVPASQELNYLLRSSYSSSGPSAVYIRREDIAGNSNCLSAQYLEVNFINPPSLNITDSGGAIVSSSTSDVYLTLNVAGLQSDGGKLVSLYKDPKCRLRNVDQFNVPNGSTTGASSRMEKLFDSPGENNIYVVVSDLSSNTETSCMEVGLVINRIPISNRSELAAIDPYKHYILSNDIDLATNDTDCSNVSGSLFWTPLNDEFNGTLFGNGQNFADFISIQALAMLDYFSPLVKKELFTI